MRRFAPLAFTEPFRGFFPLGMILGVIGISLWPLFYAGVIDIYPLAAHLRHMIYGFLSCFVFGFLFTAGPRLLGCPSPGKLIVLSYFVSVILAAIFAVVSPKVSDLIFVLQIVGLLSMASWGFKNRKDLPPPGFLLGLAGLACALVGGLLLCLLSFGFGGSLSYQLSRILLFQGFPVLPLIGIGAFFFPKLSQVSNPQDFPVNRVPSKAWLKRAAFAVATILGFALSIVLELQGQHKAAYLLRAVTFAAYLILETPLFKRSANPNSQSIHLALCSLVLVASFALIAFYPVQRTAFLHGFFICGLTGSIMLVATRVIFGHSGNIQLAQRSRKPLLWAIALLAFAAGSRIVADFLPELRTTHYIYASIFWLVIATIWITKVAPKVAVSDTSDSS